MSPAESIYERPLTPREVADAAELVAWFTRRYPTAKERLAYVRRAVRRWRPARPA
jgi:hypothetical protein